LRLKKYLEQGWTCKNEIPVEMRNKLAESLDKSKLPKDLKGCEEFNRTWWTAEGTKLSIAQALVAKPEFEPALSEAGSSEQGGLRPQRPMKHNDQQLQELLRLARSCLKYERLPGELTMRGFFDKFEAEIAAHDSTILTSLQSEGNEEQPSGSKPVTEASQPAGAKETIDATMSSLGLAKRIMKNAAFLQILEQSLKEIEEATTAAPLCDETPADSRTLKSQASQLEIIASEAKKALEACAAELSLEVMKKMQLDKEEKTLETDLLKAQRQLRLAKDMVRRQNGETKKLHNDIQELKVAAAGSTQSAPAAVGAPQPPASGPGRPKGGRPSRPAGRLLNSSHTDSSSSAAAPVAADGSGSASSKAAAAESLEKSSTGDGGERMEQRSQGNSQPTPPRLASSIVLPPKDRKHAPVLASRPTSHDLQIDAKDMWKLYIP